MKAFSFVEASLFWLEMRQLVVVSEPNTVELTLD